MVVGLQNQLYVLGEVVKYMDLVLNRNLEMVVLLVKEKNGLMMVNNLKS